ncbi:MAG: ACP S-malonyltransferase [Gammaproteobacteria bacterium]|nr:ACP S-malonyltransferase [Gammaproteobacteria bacterium]
MMSIAIVFPGQGSQSVGMLANLAETWPQVKETFAEAGSVLGYDLWQLVQQGPEEALNQTDKTQPAMLTAGVAVWRAWRAAGGRAPAFMAGHSLGEYTALVCAEAIDFKVAVKLVETRGQLMQAAVPAGQGAMAAILGLSDADVIAACEEAAQGEVVEAVNFNAPGQVVVAGAKNAVERAATIAKDKGAKRAIILPVSVPSHCALMRPAADKIAEVLVKTEIKAPKITVLHNVDVGSYSDANAIRKALTDQLFRPVRWVETVQTLAREGISQIVEAGPGKVLAGLNKRIEKEVTTLPVYDAETLLSAVEAVK